MTLNAINNRFFLTSSIRTNLHIVIAKKIKINGVKTILLTVLLLNVSIQASEYCNMDTFYNLADFSSQGYQNLCRKGDIARVKRKDAHLYCDKSKGMEVISILEKKDNIIFECKFLNVKNHKRAKIYRWTDNSGNIQFTNNSPPKDCLSPECLQIHQAEIKEGDLEHKMERTIADYKTRLKQQQQRTRGVELSQNPTIRDYFEAQSTSSLCKNLHIDRNPGALTQLADKLKELYGPKTETVIQDELKLALSRRFSVTTEEIQKTLDLLAGIWVGMNEKLLNCLRPSPYLIYKPANRFGAPLKQYIYKIDSLYEYVDVQNGVISNIRTLSISPDG